MRFVFYLIGVAALSFPLWAGEYVVLDNGSRLHADRHELSGAKIRIFSGNGITEMPAGAVSGFEEEEIQPRPAAPALAQDTPTPPTKAAVPPSPSRPEELAAEAARTFALPEAFVRSVMKAESGFRPDAISPKGALGLMQLMPETARTLGVDPKNPLQNAHGGAQYLRELLARYENRPDQVLLALAAYNAGPAAVERYHGVPPYRETKEYILRVLKSWERAGNK